MDELIRARLESVSIRSVLEISFNSTRDAGIRTYCLDKGFNYLCCTPPNCLDLQQRVDFALIHGIESCEFTLIRECVGRLKNLLSERIWVLVDSNYCPPQEWVSLGFKKDSLLDSIDRVSYSYNLETYNGKRDWNNSRFWANPENWNKRF